MINRLPYYSIQTDLNIYVNPNNNMELIVDFTNLKSEYHEVINSNGPITIPFASHDKYDKIISIFLLRNGKLIVDEMLDDVFYFETPIIEQVDKICWFSIPVNYNNAEGLNNLIIYAKGGVDNGM